MLPESTYETVYAQFNHFDPGYSEDRDLEVEGLLILYYDTPIRCLKKEMLGVRARTDCATGHELLVFYDTNSVYYLRSEKLAF